MLFNRFHRDLHQYEGAAIVRALNMSLFCNSRHVGARRCTIRDTWAWLQREGLITISFNGFCRDLQQYRGCCHRQSVWTVVSAILDTSVHVVAPLDVPEASFIDRIIHLKSPSMDSSVHCSKARGIVIFWDFLSSTMSLHVVAPAEMPETQLMDRSVHRGAVRRTLP
jgi:hypothetical protein